MSKNPGWATLRFPAPSSQNVAFANVEQSEVLVQGLTRDTEATLNSV